MPTKFMKLGFDEQVLRGLRNEADGYVVEVGLNYYRGTPISAVERLELSVDGERLLVEINGKYLRLYEVPLAHTEYWGVKTPIRIHVLGAPLAAGEHEVDLVCQARVVYMQFAPGVYGMFDASAASTLTVSES